MRRSWSEVWWRTLHQELRSTGSRLLCRRRCYLLRYCWWLVSEEWQRAILNIVDFIGCCCLLHTAKYDRRRKLSPSSSPPPSPPPHPHRHIHIRSSTIATHHRSMTTSSISRGRARTSLAHPGHRRESSSRSQSSEAPRPFACEWNNSGTERQCPKVRPNTVTA